MTLFSIRCSGSKSGSFAVLFFLGEVTLLLQRRIKSLLSTSGGANRSYLNLLLLPDYLAGYVHYSSDPSRISPPAKVSKQGLETFGQDLSSLITFDVIEYAFDETFPNLTMQFTGR